MSEKQDLVRELREVIENAEDYIHAEYVDKDFEGTEGNPWFACFNGVLFAIRGKLALIEKRELLDEDSIENLWRKLDQLGKNSDAVTSENDWDPPEQVRAEFLKN